jgi:Methylamine utilisation protein MauE/AhpC/TSA family
MPRLGSGLGLGASDGLDASVGHSWGERGVSTVVLFARLGLAVVFALAGAAKLADLAGSRQAVRGFGVPAALAGVIGTLLPLAELAVAGSLIVSASARWGAFGALMLFGAFVVGIAAALGKGNVPDCHCFGQLHSAPAGWPTLARNLVFAGVAAVVVLAGPGLSVGAWLGSLSHQQDWVLAGALVGVVLAGQSGLVWVLLRRHGAVLSRLRELEGAATTGGSALTIGDPAPPFDLPGLASERVSLAGLLSAGRGALLVFTDPRCGPCQALLPQLAAWQDAHADRVTVALISRGSAAENLFARDQHGLRHVARQAEHQTDTPYGVLGTPSAILIGADGRVLEPLVTGAGQIADLALRLPTGTPLASAPDHEHRGAGLAITVHSPNANHARTRTSVAAQPHSAIGLATGVVALSGAAAASAAAGGERAAANKIARALGDLIRKIAPETFAGSHALRGARTTAPGKPIRLPAGTQVAWHRRFRDIDQAHAAIAGVHGADAARKAALDALGVLRAACRAGELALTSPTASKRNHYAKQQVADERRLRTAIQDLTSRLHQAGVIHL